MLKMNFNFKTIEYAFGLGSVNAGNHEK